MSTIFRQYNEILKKHITLCNVAKKYTFEKMQELVPEVQSNIKLIQDSLSMAVDDSTCNSEDDADKVVELPISKFLSLNRLFQKQEEYDALTNYLPNNLIVSVASSYDIYLSVLLQKTIIDKNMFGLIKKELSLNDVLKYSCKEDLASDCVEEKISELMRKSHKEQVEWVEKSFKIDIINSFLEWKTVFEFFQVRNIIVHNDGVVNQIFIEELKKTGISAGKYKLGEKIIFNPEEISKQIRCIIDFSAYLFSMILRTLYKGKDNLEKIDGILNNIVYDFLCQKKYTQVVSIVDNILKSNQQHNSADVFMLTINKCIALKNNGNNSYIKILEKLDWSNCENDFKFARAILMNETEQACAIMESLDKEDMIFAYVEWPLCKDFIKTEEFKLKFKEIYGTDFEETLSKLSDEKSQYLYENKIIELATSEGDGECKQAVPELEEEAALVLV